jgi:dihydroorotate dehydrogenase (NAD+) catalytic subunit
MPDLSVNVAGLSLNFPAMLGSGPIGVRSKDLIEYGRVAGAIVTKSITAEPCSGSRTPRIAKIDHDGMLNYEGNPNPGIDEFAATLQKIMPSIPCPVIGSISPDTLREESKLERMVEKFIGAGVKGIELDYKYLYNEAVGLTNFEPKELADICARVGSVAPTVIIVKLAVGFIPLPDLARAAEDGGAHAISAINTVFPAMRIGLRTRRPVLSTKFGGLSGAPIRPLAIAAIYQLRRLTKLPLIGIGGVRTPEDIAEFLLAGATAVQVYTAAQVGGPSVFTELRTGLPALLDKMGVSSVSALVGAAHDSGESEEEHEGRRMSAVGT